MVAADEDEAELFRRAMQGVRPIATGGRVAPPRRRPVPRARFARAERHAVLEESIGPPAPELDIQPGDALSHRRDGVPETVLKRMRRGAYRIEAQIDLHGLTLEAGKQVLRDFIAASLDSRLRVVRIVHGKGMRSGRRGPVLKQAVNSMLRRQAAVLAFTSAGIRDGGTGATLVLLREVG
jgi:DNA-nicking Smr family endonuclease